MNQLPRAQAENSLAKTSHARDLKVTRFHATRASKQTDNHHPQQANNNNNMSKDKNKQVQSKLV